MIEIDVELLYDMPRPVDVLLQIEAAAMADQRLVANDLRVTSSSPIAAVPGEEAIGQRTWLRAEGQFWCTYRATVDIQRVVCDLAALACDAPHALPGLVVPYLMPSRYCESDKLEAFVDQEFGSLRGGAKVAAMRDWVREHIEYASGTSTGTTTAADTFVQRQGVCRDFAHLLAAMARAATVPARVVSAYAPGVDPPDFHAVVEIWLGGGWHLIDPTGMSGADELVRVAVGRDATDIAFMTVFGTAQLLTQTVKVRRTHG